MRIFSASATARRTRTNLFSCCSALALTALGCSGAAASAPAGAGGAPSGLPSAGAAGVAGTAGASNVPRPPTPGCRAPAGVSSSPQSIAETVTLINSLPKPLTLPCFLESLARPLEMHATFSIISAQPAVGARSPRVFLFIGPNTMSVALDGVGNLLLEFGEVRADYRSLKGEITFPLTANISPTAPFENVMFNDQLTTCGLCHAAEIQESALSGVRAFVSESLRPAPSDQVFASALSHELAICNPAAEPYRCAMLDGLMGWGTMNDHQFPAGMATFGQQ